MVHFDVRFDPRYQTITTGNIVDILSRELNPETSRYLANLTIEAGSLEVQESLKALNAQTSLQSTASTLPPTTTAPPPRRCSKLDLAYCRHLPYNISSYPNVLGHKSLTDVEEDVIAFRYFFFFRFFSISFFFSTEPQSLFNSCLSVFSVTFIFVRLYL